MRISATILCWLFTALLIVAGAAKLSDMPGFVAVVDTYRVLPEVLLWPAAWALALGELGLGLWLMAGRSPAAALAVLALHAVYLAWLTLAYARGLDLPNCGCFGVHWPRPLTLQTFLEDGVLLMLAAWLWFSLKRSLR